MSMGTQGVDLVVDPALTTRRYRAAVEGRDAAGVMGTLAADGVLRSPISSLALLQGRAEILQVIEVVMDNVSDVVCLAELTGEDGDRALVVQGRIAGLAFEETAWLRFDEQGLISQLTLFIRPLAALTAFTAAIGPALAARHSRTRALLATATTRPLAALTRQGDPVALRLTGTRRV